MKRCFLVFLLIALSACGASKKGTPGIDYPLKFESGSILVKNAVRQTFFPEDDQVNVREGYEFVFVSIEIKGVVPSAGINNSLHNLMNGDWVLVDIMNQQYRPSGLVRSDLVFEVLKPAIGLRLTLGPSVLIPLGSFFGEEEFTQVPQAQGIPLATASNADWSLKVMEADWGKITGIPGVSGSDHENILALVLNLEYKGSSGELNSAGFINVTDKTGQALPFLWNNIINNGKVPDGGNEWLSQTDIGGASRSFLTGETFQSVVLFFVGQEDAKGLILQVDDLPVIELSDIITIITKK